MPTIAEILAAKKLKQAPAAAPASPADKSLTEAIDRIDPKGKHRKQVLMLTDAPAEPLAPTQPTTPSIPDPRSLASPAGERFPMHPPASDTAAVAWETAANALESELCVMQDPSEPEVCWLACRSPRHDLPPLLLHRLPWVLWPHPAPTTPGDPF